VTPLAEPKSVSTQIRSFPAATSDFFLEHLSSPRFRLAHLMKSAGSSHSAPAPLQESIPSPNPPSPILAGKEHSSDEMGDAVRPRKKKPQTSENVSSSASSLSEQQQILPPPPSNLSPISEGYPATESIPSPNPPAPILAGKEYSSDEMGDAVRSKKKKSQKSENVSSIRRYLLPSVHLPMAPSTVLSSNPYALLEDPDDDTEGRASENTRVSTPPSTHISAEPLTSPHTHSSLPHVPIEVPHSSPNNPSHSHHSPSSPASPLSLKNAVHVPKCTAPPYSYYNPFKHDQQNQWCGTTTSGQIAMALHPEDIDRFRLLPPPHRSLYQQLTDELLLSSQMHIAVQPGRQDFSFTPGSGVCALAALGMISHSMAYPEDSIYPTLALENLSHRKFLRSLINRLSAALMTHRSPLAPELRRSLTHFLHALPTIGPIKPLPSAQYLPSDLFLLAANALSLPVALWSSHHDPDRSPVLSSWAVLEGTSDDFPVPPQLPIQLLTSFLSQAHHVILRHNRYYVMRAENMSRDLSAGLQSLKDKISSQALQHELRHRYFTPAPASSPLSSPHLPSSLPHELLTGQQLQFYNEPLTVTIPSSPTLEKIMEETAPLPTSEQQGQRLKDLLQCEPIFHIHTTLSVSPPSYSRSKSPTSAYLVLFHVHRRTNLHNRSVYSPILSANDYPAFIDFLLSLTKLPDLSSQFVTKLQCTHRHFVSNSFTDMLPLLQEMSPPEFRSLLFHINPHASLWASLIPPHIQLMGAPYPSPFSPLGVNAARMLSLSTHPCIIFHDSGYFLFSLPFRQSQIESSIALHHNALLDSVSHCPQGRLSYPTSPHSSPVLFSQITPTLPTLHRTPLDCEQHKSLTSKVLLSPQCSSSARSRKTPIAHKKPHSSITKPAKSDSDSDYEETPSKSPHIVSSTTSRSRQSPRLQTSTAHRPRASPTHCHLSPSSSPILDDLSWDPTASGRIHIKTSEVSPDAGKGAFASVAIDIDETICSYFGDPCKRLTPKQANSPKYVSDYVLVIDHVAIDAQDRATLKILCGAGYINEAFDEHLANCVFKRIGNRIFVVATRDISPGEELLILYGEEYWRTSRWSLSLLRKAVQHYSRDATRQLWSDLICHAEAQEKRRSDPHMAADNLSDIRMSLTFFFYDVSKT
jgi:hypothetical protein